MKDPASPESTTHAAGGAVQPLDRRHRARGLALLALAARLPILALVVALAWPLAVPAAGNLPALAGVQQLAVGHLHGCVLTSAGGVQCWGGNGFGQLGDGTTSDRLVPVPVVGLASGVAAISVGYQHSCALMDDGSARCWGNNTLNQLGDGSDDNRSTPVTVSGLGHAIAIAAGGHHSCALINDGSMKCWGYNGDGALGVGDEVNRPSATEVLDIDHASAMATGYATTCALSTLGEVSCWGVYDRACDSFGCTFGYAIRPQSVPSLGSDITAISAGEYFQCALTTGGAVKCWGDNYDKVLGDLGTVDPDPFTPHTISGLGSGAASVSAGYDHACARRDDGSLRCWGDGGFAQLGDGSTDDHATPVSVSALAGPAAAVGAGGHHSCALLADSRVQCWGSNGSGQLGNNEPWTRTTPMDVVGLGSGVTAISAGDDHTCALLTSGAVRCWGSNANGQLGVGSTINQPTPVAVTALGSGNVAISAAGAHSCAITSGGAVQCWGDNSKGQLGDGSQVDRSVPTPVSGLPGAIAHLGAGALYTCALTATGAAWCWGNNDSNQLGVVTAQTSSPQPLNLYYHGSVGRMIAAGGAHTCSISSDDRIRCWGGNGDGQLGLGDYDKRHYPTLLGQPGSASMVELGATHSCAIAGNGDALCWGNSDHGQVGISIGLSATPVVPGGTFGLDFSAISAGYRHTCAVVDDGSARCWGDNAAGQLGHGDYIDSWTAVDVTGLSAPLMAISSGRYHSCALTQAGGVQCWGGNSSGQLGIGLKNNRLPGFVLANPVIFRDGFEAPAT